jgi:hypothetical protein
MYPANDYLLWVIREETTLRYLRQAEIDHLLSEVEPRQPGGLAYRVRPALRKLGHLFLALGSVLDRIEPQAAQSSDF